MRADLHFKAEDERLAYAIRHDLIVLRFKLGWSMADIVSRYEFEPKFVEDVIREHLNEHP